MKLQSAEELRELGRRLSLDLPPDSVLALSGELGAGKTTLVQGIAEGLGIEVPMQSPTFVLLHSERNLHHFDLYRLKSSADFLALGFDEYFDRGGICAIEWAERIEDILPARTIWIHIAYCPEGREVTCSKK